MVSAHLLGGLGLLVLLLLGDEFALEEHLSVAEDGIRIQRAAVSLRGVAVAVTARL